MKKALDPDMPAQQLRMHLGEMTAQEERTARAVIRWANSQHEQQQPASTLVEALEIARDEACSCKGELGRCLTHEFYDDCIAIARQYTREPDVEAGASGRFLGDVAAEVTRARAKFPEGRHFIPALSEEHGELSNALLEQEYGKPITSEMVYKEAVQVAAMAMRIAEEGVLEFPKYQPPFRQREPSNG